MADGRVQPLADLLPGDRVYGTCRRGRPRYAETIIKALGAKAQPAYRITLADGTQFVVGADQRLLTYRGWKHTVGAEQGRNRRPHLTLRAKVLGSGHFYRPPVKSPDYRRGDLCGLIRGDGHIGSYVCRPPGKATWVKHGFRLAMADTEALDRGEGYLTGAGVEVRRFVFQPSAPGYRAISALGNQSRGGVESVRRLIRWPTAPSDAWRRGFLAGIFDAEGSCPPEGPLRISNSDAAILEWIEACLTRFSFDVVRESPNRGNRVSYFRLRGGLRARLRFFQTMDPAITRKRVFAGLALQSDADLRVTSSEALGGRIEMTEVLTDSGDLIADGVVVGAGI